MPAGGMVTAGVVASSVIGGLLSSSSAKKAAKAQQAAAAAAFAELNKLGLPPDISKEVILKQFSSMGILSPELEQEVNLQESQVSKIQEDPSLRNASMEVLNTLGGMSRGGLRAEDRAAYNELRSRVQQDAEAKRQQLMQKFSSIGMTNSGANIASQLQSIQASADSASAGADSLAAEASRAAANALTQRANLAGNIRTQDMSAEQMKARAIDERNRFLYENSVIRQRQNTAAVNAAQESNLKNQQNVANANINQENEESLRQNEAKRQYYMDQLDLAKAKANALNSQGSAASAGYEARGKAQAGIFGAIGQGIGAYGSYLSDKPQVKERLSSEQVAGRKAESEYKF